MSEPWNPQPIQEHPRRASLPDAPWVADAALPFVWGATLGLAAAGVAWPIIVMQDTGDLVARIAPSCGGSFVAFCAVLGIVASLTIVWRRALWTLEGITGRDLYPGGPVDSAKVEDWTLEIHNDGFEGLPPIQYLKVGIDRKRLVEAARLVVNGDSLSHGNMTGKGKPLSRDELTALQEELVELGHARWRSEKSPTQGVELTAPGRAMFKALAAQRV